MVICCRANNEKKELETKQRSAVTADSQSKTSASLLGAAAAASSDGQTQLHELKKRNDELEDEVRWLC